MAVRRLRDLMELARISNLPTCMTNVLVGAVLGGLSVTTTAGLGELVLVALAICLMYVGGMALNDAIDAPIDRAERSGRPIPSGRVARSTAFAIAFGALAAGLALLTPLGPTAPAWGAALVVAIVVYDVLHKKNAVFTVLMGVCRGLVYVVAAAAITNSALPWREVGPVAGAMTVYIVLVTILARAEAQPARSAASLLLWVLPIVVLAPVMVVRPTQVAPAVVMGVLTTAWILISARHLHTHPPAPPRAIMGWLAAICLADGWFLALLDQPHLAIACIACFLLTLYGHQRILGS